MKVWASGCVGMGTYLTRDMGGSALVLSSSNYNLVIDTDVAGVGAIQFHQAGRTIWNNNIGPNAGSIHWNVADNAAFGMYLTQAGQLYANAFTLFSDRRAKKNLRPYTSTAVLSALKIHEFEWIKNNGYGRGLVAQDAQSIIPHAVSEGVDTINELTGEYDQSWGVDYGKLVPDLIVGWQNHEARIKALEARLVGPES